MKSHLYSTSWSQSFSQYLSRFRIAEKENQGLVLLTATPHSGKPAEFQSLLGLIREELKNWMFRIRIRTTPPRSPLCPKTTGDIQALSEKRLFPTRESEEANYALSDQFLGFDDLLGHRGIVGATSKQRSLCSLLDSPRSYERLYVQPLCRDEHASVPLDKLSLEEDSGEDDNNPVHDLEFGFDSDLPRGSPSANEWMNRKRKLGELAKQLETLKT